MLDSHSQAICTMITTMNTIKEGTKSFEISATIAQRAAIEDEFDPFFHAQVSFARVSVRECLQVPGRSRDLERWWNM
ncbi:MAG: hypothetical protein RBG13Loki_4145 [Promethearchaeota archaeon CR_4]|nr:MAG: hypothetical protein RBG13Loki_4145 [Candidatus Lokiarchaeota archaeon CR_4]